MSTSVYDNLPPVDEILISKSETPKINTDSNKLEKSEEEKKAATKGSRFLLYCFISAILGSSLGLALAFLLSQGNLSFSLKDIKAILATVQNYFPSL